MQWSQFIEITSKVKVKIDGCNNEVTTLLSYHVHVLYTQVLLYMYREKTFVRYIYTLTIKQ